MTSREQAVRERYGEAANQREEALCCPVTYNSSYLEAIPPEIIERDYGCGDPSAFVRPGETVLDLGSGGGKLCYIAAQVVGAQGRVIGVDCNDEMLSLARKYQGEVAKRIGYSNVDFRCGLIQDLQLDLEHLASELSTQRSTGVQALLDQRDVEDRLRRDSPMITGDSVDCVVSNCVLNLVRPEDRRRLFAEVFRVLKRGGRAAISDIVSDEDVPQHLKADGVLWSGCISGAWREDEFVAEFERAGFHGITIEKRQSEPWQTVEGIEFRSITVVAYKGKQGPCLDRHQAVIYRGPFKSVTDDDGHTYFRGEKMASCDKTTKLLQHEPYAGSFEVIEPYEEIALDDAKEYDCRKNARRTVQQTKGKSFKETFVVHQANGCDGDNSCC